MKLTNYLSNFGTYFNKPHSDTTSFRSIDSINTFKCGFSNFAPYNSNIFSLIVDLDDSEKELQHIFNNSFEIFVQNISGLPNISVQSNSNINTSLGSFTSHSSAITSGTQEIRLSIINTGKPILEKIFLPWLREIQSPRWIYEDSPFTKATFTVDMTDHTDVKYVFLGCRPTQIGALTATHANGTGNLTRTVTLSYDMVYIGNANSYI